MMPADPEYVFRVPRARALVTSLGLLGSGREPELDAALGSVERAVLVDCGGKGCTGLAARVSDQSLIDVLMARPRAVVEGRTEAGGQRIRRDKSRVATWYPSTCTLVVGGQPFATAVEDVLAGRRPALSDDALFQRSQTSFDEDALASGYVVPWLFAVREPELGRARAARWFSGGRPLEMVVNGGARLTVALRAQLSGDAVPSAQLYAPPVRLTAAARLPAETVAFVAYASNFGLSGAPLADELGALFPNGEQQGGQQGGLWTKVRALLAAAGDQGVVGLLAPPGAAGRKTSKIVLYGAVVIVQRVRDDPDSRSLLETVMADAAKQLASDRRRDIEGGFVVASKEQGHALTVVHGDGHLFVAVGDSALTRRALRAFRTGKETLASDPHKRALIERLPNKRLVLWADSEWAATVDKRPGEKSGLLAGGERLSWLDFAPKGDGYEVTAEVDVASGKVAFELMIARAMARYFEGLKLFSD